MDLSGQLVSPRMENSTELEAKTEPSNYGKHVKNHMAYGDSIVNLS